MAVGLPTIRPDNYFSATISASCITCTTFRSFAFSYFYADWTEGTYGAHSSTSSGLLSGVHVLAGQSSFGAANVRAYHATNVVLHTLNGLLVWAIVALGGSGPQGSCAPGGFVVRAHAKPCRSPLPGSADASIP